MVENFSSFMQDTNLKFQENEQIHNKSKEN